MLGQGYHQAHVKNGRLDIASLVEDIEVSLQDCKAGDGIVY